jgi:hypothetical protein|tara:strand:+ start:3362 stop:3511 length:150 start_codon:yes stop_codon:yes gene_type:complete
MSSKGLVKGRYAVDHGTRKKGDEGTFAKSTYDALIKHGILTKAKTKKAE